MRYNIHSFSSLGSVERNKANYLKEFNIIIKNIKTFKLIIENELNIKNKNRFIYKNVCLNFLRGENTHSIQATIDENGVISIKTNDYDPYECRTDTIFFVLNLGKKVRLNNHDWKLYQSIENKESDEYKTLDFKFEVANLFNEHKILVSIQHLFWCSPTYADSLGFWRQPDIDFNQYQIKYS